MMVIWWRHGDVHSVYNSSEIWLQLLTNRHYFAFYEELDVYELRNVAKVEV